MEKFKKYLISSQIVAEKKVKYYVNWVSKFYYSCKKDPGAAVTQNEIDEYLKNLPNAILGFDAAWNYERLVL